MKTELDVSSEAILVAFYPHYRCCIFTNDYGPICLSSEGSCQNDKPVIESLSLLHMDQMTNALSYSLPMVNLGEHEIRVFPKDFEENLEDGEKKGTIGVSIEQQKLLDVIANMRGLRERLLDASAAAIIEDSKGEVSHFLLRSEAIIAELQSAIAQHVQKTKRNNSRRGNKRQRVDCSSGDVLNDVTFSSAYYDEINQQCLQVQELLLRKSHDHDLQHEIELNDDITKMAVKYYDEKSRCHQLSVEIPVNFPLSGPKNWICDLPIEFEVFWNGSLATIVDRFIDTVTAYQSFWNEMDDIDSNTWVLEPSLARRSCIERRIALCAGLSIHFILEPERSVAAPLKMRLIGAHKNINELRKAYRDFVSIEEEDSSDNSKKGKRWSEKISFRSNIEVCFGMILPSPETTEKTDYVVECGVCYAHHLPLDNGEDGNESSAAGESAIPNIPCNNVSCGRLYHEKCLSEWLHSLPTKVSFGRIFGQCPYCCESISVPIPGGCL